MYVYTFIPTPVPEIAVRKVTPQDAFIVVASDGVFEFLTNQVSPPSALLPSLSHVSGSIDALDQFDPILPRRAPPLPLCVIYTPTHPLHHQSVVEMIRQHADPLEACHAVVQEAYDLWLQVLSCFYSTDCLTD
jgi:hypothetical protein